MLNIRQSGSMPDLTASLRAIPRYVMPYAAATALTRTAQFAVRTELPNEMRSVFQSPVAYTLNALRMEPATKDSLVARVMVKNQAAGVAPENFLLPQVEGGGRKHKRAEAAMRYAGVLRSNQFALPGAGLSLDAAGNVKGSEVRTILTALKNIRGGDGKGKKLANSLFVGKPIGGDRPDGIWRREGKRLRALFVFTQDAPSYSQRLNFDGVVQRVALQRFRPEFERSASAMLARGGRA